MPPEHFFEPINDVGYGIFDTELNTFVRLKRTHKSAWAKSHHAASAFANACSTYGSHVHIKDQTRYEIRKF